MFLFVCSLGLLLLSFFALLLEQYYIMFYWDSVFFSRLETNTTGYDFWSEQVVHERKRRKEKETLVRAIPVCEDECFSKNVLCSFAVTKSTRSL